MEDNIMQDKESLDNHARTGETESTPVSEETQAVKEQTDNTDETERLTQEIEALKDKYLRLVADFDNFRKRTARERLDLIQTAGSSVITALLPVLDDCGRAEEQLKMPASSPDDSVAVNEGIILIFNKLRNILQSKGLKPMESIGSEFNPEFHEAVTGIPAPDPSLSGKVLDEVEKGYYLNDKIIRFAKVVVGK